VSFTLTSTAFGDFELFPPECTTLSPPLSWTDPPAGTRSLALLFELRPKLYSPWERTLEAEPETYWLAWGLPPRAGELGTGAKLPREGTGSTGEIGYSLPPITRDQRRVLVFRLLALSDELRLDRGATRSELLQAAAALVLDEADLETVWEPGRPRFYERLRRLLG
jgi:phosphatidylethanolamine-binding protein (PEBP) family uncharacterized protein